MTVEVNWPDIGDLDKLIKETWEAAEPHLWFKLTHPPRTLRVRGIHSLVLVDNKPRFDTRRRPPPFKDLVQAFSEEGFNFNKIKKEEIMLYIHNVALHLPTNDITMAINVSPLFKYHSLILPYPLECKGQVFDEFNLRIIIDFAMKCTDQAMVILGNSLLAHASVNHIHYHLLYPTFVPSCTLASGELFISSCRLLVDYFFPGFLFVVTETNLSQVKYDLVLLIEVLQMRDIPHNLVFCKRVDKATLVLVFPRKSTIHTQKSQGMPGEHKVPFFVAAAELAGIIPVTEGFEDLTESDCLAIMKESMLDDKIQEEILRGVKVRIGSLETENRSPIL